MRSPIFFRLASFLFLIFSASILLAAKMTLKDGTVLEGDVKKVGGSYSIKTKDGLKMIAGGDVVSIDDPTGKVSLGGSSAAGAPGSTSKQVTGSADFDNVARACDRVTTPIVAVTKWQKYIDDHPQAPDLDKAKAELARWQEMADKGAEKIKGKWVSGDELKAIKDKVKKLMKESIELMRDNQTLKSIDKVNEIIKIYPNSFEAHFHIGYIHLLKGGAQEYEKAIASLETACRIKPNSPEALSNLSIAYNFSKQYEKAVTTGYKAVQIEDSTPVVQNLVNAVYYAPPAMRTNNPRIVPIMHELPVLMSRHGIGGPSESFIYLHPRTRTDKKPRSDDDDDKANAVPGLVGSGTGFFVNSQGYIFTNRHVAAAGDTMIIKMSDGSQKTAEKVLVDDEQDIAVLHIKNDKPTPFIHMAAYDSPPIGTDVTVMGFPLGAMLGDHVKITRGVVTSYETKSPECDVIVDAQVNPGNSGGPMIDKYGNLMALVAMKTFADETVSSYGLGISTSRLRGFLDRQKDKLKEMKLEVPEKDQKVLNTEEIASTYTKSVVMILIVNGGDSDDAK